MKGSIHGIGRGRASWSLIAVVAGVLLSLSCPATAQLEEIIVTAQRIESLDHSKHDFEVRPCRILISEKTRECVEGIVRTEEFGDVMLKGKKDPVTIYRVCERIEPLARTEPQ